MSSFGQRLGSSFGVLRFVHRHHDVRLARQLSQGLDFCRRGDGVDQDDYVASGGSAGFEAPTAIRADQVIVRSVRLPYLKFPTNPTN